MHNAPGVLQALQSIDTPKELAQLIEELIDAVPMVNKGEVLAALAKVQGHELKARR